MPNWCENSLTISGPLEILKELEEAQLSLQKLFPCPKELLETSAPAVYNDKEKAEINKEKYGYPDWYSWQVANWGTKWDLSIHSIDVDEGVDGKGYLCAGFDTAWSPPVEAMRKIFEKYKGRGLKIEMEYFEPGCSFIGKVTANDEDDFFDEYYDYQGSEDLESCIKELGGHDLAEYELEYLREREEEERQEKEAEEKAAAEAQAKAEDKVKPEPAKPKAAAKKTVKSAPKKTAKKPAVKKTTVKKATAKSVKSPATKKAVKK
jgi:chemotaxis protein histidine kinase CheA